MTDEDRPRFELYGYIDKSGNKITNRIADELGGILSRAVPYWLYALSLYCAQQGVIREYARNERYIRAHFVREMETIFSHEMQKHFPAMMGHELAGFADAQRHIEGNAEESWCLFAENPKEGRAYRSFRPLGLLILF